MRKLFSSLKKSKLKELILNEGDEIKDETMTGKVSGGDDTWKELELKFTKKEYYRDNSYIRLCNWIENKFPKKSYMARIESEKIHVKIKVKSK